MTDEGWEQCPCTAALLAFVLLAGSISGAQVSGLPSEEGSVIEMSETCCRQRWPGSVEFSLAFFKQTKQRNTVREGASESVREKT